MNIIEKKKKKYYAEEETMTLVALFRRGLGSAGLTHSDRLALSTIPLLIPGVVFRTPSFWLCRSHVL